MPVFDDIFKGKKKRTQPATPQAQPVEAETPVATPSAPAGSLAGGVQPVASASTGTIPITASAMKGIQGSAVSAAAPAEPQAQQATPVSSASPQQEQPAAPENAPVAQSATPETPPVAAASTPQPPASQEDSPAVTSVAGSAQLVKPATPEGIDITPNAAQGVYRSAGVEGPVVHPQTAPAAEREADAVAELGRATRYQQMVESLRKPTVLSPEEQERELKRQRQRAIIAAIGDGLSAISNMYTASRGGIVNPIEATLSQANRARYDAMIAKREKEQEAYLAALERAGFEDQAQQYRIDLENLKSENSAQKAADALAAKEKEAEAAREFKRKEAEQKTKDDAAKRSEKYEYDKKMQEQRAKDARALENVRAANRRIIASKTPYSFSSGGKTVSLSEAQASDAYATGIELGIIPKEDSKVSLTTTSEDGVYGTKTSTREVPFRFKDQSSLSQQKSIRDSYEAQQLLEAGFPVEVLRDAIKEGIPMEEIKEYNQ